MVSLSPDKPLTKYSVCDMSTLVSGDSKVLYPNASSRSTAIVPLGWKLRQPNGYIGLHIRLNQYAQKRFSVMAEGLNPKAVGK